MQEAISEGEKYGAPLQELWQLIENTSSAEDFGSQLYPYFTKSCVCTFLQGFCRECDTSTAMPFFSDPLLPERVASSATFSDNVPAGGLGDNTGFGDALSSRSDSLKSSLTGKDDSSSKVEKAGFARKPQVGSPLASPSKEGEALAGTVSKTSQQSPTRTVSNSSAPSPLVRRQQSAFRTKRLQSIESTNSFANVGAGHGTRSQELILGDQTWNMLKVMIDHTFTPEVQQEKIYAVGDLFTGKVEDSWTWFWRDLSGWS
ncbi:hypothetical protein T484DRAFT_1778655 [Baffinella frigidus]|nr:hypothetical protein T484DRAFT_1778655 [Cryptophyta sp. CCMP2293]